MTSSQNRRARSPLSDKTEGKPRSRSLSKNSKFDPKSVIAYVKGIPITSNVPSKRSKESARGDKSESSGDSLLQPERKKEQGVDSSFDDIPLTPRRRENLVYPLKNPDSPPPNAYTGRPATPVPTSAPFVRLGVGPAPAGPTGVNDPGGRSSSPPPPPPGLEKQSGAAYFKTNSPATSNDP